MVSASLHYYSVSVKHELSKQKPHNHTPKDCVNTPLCAFDPHHKVFPTGRTFVNMYLPDMRAMVKGRCISAGD